MGSVATRGCGTIRPAARGTAAGNQASRVCRNGKSATGIRRRRPGLRQGVSRNSAAPTSFPFPDQKRFFFRGPPSLCQSRHERLPPRFSDRMRSVATADRNEGENPMIGRRDVGAGDMSREKSRRGEPKRPAGHEPLSSAWLKTLAGIAGTLSRILRKKGGKHGQRLSGAADPDRG